MIDTVGIAGYMTQVCCDTTARQAFHRGYNVEFLRDTTGTLDVANKAGSVTVDEWHDEVADPMAEREGRRVESQTMHGSWLLTGHHEVVGS